MKFEVQREAALPAVGPEVAGEAGATLRTAVSRLTMLKTNPMRSPARRYHVCPESQASTMSPSSSSMLLSLVSLLSNSKSLSGKSIPPYRFSYLFYFVLLLRILDADFERLYLFPTLPPVFVFHHAELYLV